ncbi:MAG: hypothetical protein COZ50_14250 [Zetaproteobacteria bacterium CG_4_10_14_3_um_filter_54_28]|nr:MAG: hypothetical protein COZ50_14250 [Zetaproteobacteria bacterium CG_4_10_14_3_um_filter_54_28]
MEKTILVMVAYLLRTRNAIDIGLFRGAIAGVIYIIFFPLRASKSRIWLMLIICSEAALA